MTPVPASAVIVTKDVGARTWPIGATVTEPQCELDANEATSFAADSGLAGFYFVDIMSAFIAHERDGVHLYRTASGLTSNPALRAAFDEFGEETAEHVDIYAGLITVLGGDPNYISPAARLNEFQNCKVVEGLLLSGSVDVPTFDLALVDAVGAAEAKCFANWTFLAELARTLPDSSARDAIDDAVSGVMVQEQEHFGWATRTRIELLNAMAYGL